MKAETAFILLITVSLTYTTLLGTQYVGKNNIYCYYWLLHYTLVSQNSILAFVLCTFSNAMFHSFKKHYLYFILHALCSTQNKILMMTLVVFQHLGLDELLQSFSLNPPYKLKFDSSISLPVKKKLSTDRLSVHDNSITSKARM